MAKKNPLTQALEKQGAAEQEIKSATVVAPIRKTESNKGKQASRVGRVFVGGYFAPEVQTELKIIAAKERGTVQDLIAEGINAVLASRQRPQIATIAPQVDE